MTVPGYALGSNGKPAIMVAPAADTADFALPAVNGSHVSDLPVFKTGKVKDSLGRRPSLTTSVRPCGPIS